MSNAPRPCEHCGEPDPDETHYDGWSDWGDGEGPDGWICKKRDGAFEKWLAWREVETTDLFHSPQPEEPATP